MYVCMYRVAARLAEQVDPTLVPEWLKGKRRRQKEVV